MNDAVLVENEAGDWEGLYIDGKLVDQGHEIRRDHIVNIVRHAKSYVKEMAGDWIYDEGRLPSTLEELHQKGTVAEKREKVF